MFGDRLSFFAQSLQWSNLRASHRRRRWLTSGELLHREAARGGRALARRSDTAPRHLRVPDLAVRVRASDQAAIQPVGETYLTQILRVARGAGLDPQQAEDVTQARFATFIEVAPRFEGRSSVWTWLFGILYKKIAEARRARQRDRQMESIDEAFKRRFDVSGHWSTPPQPIDTDLHHKEVETTIFACLDAALLRQTLACIVREVVELSTEDICNVLGLTRTNLGCPASTTLASWRQLFWQVQVRPGPVSRVW